MLPVAQGPGGGEVVKEVVSASSNWSGAVLSFHVRVTVLPSIMRRNEGRFTFAYSLDGWLTLKGPR
jgi:hypothetical protein